MEKKEILLSRIYGGEFIRKGEIGFEIINMFLADDGKHYLHIIPKGTTGPAHNDCIEDILFARQVEGKHKVEILAKASGLEQVLHNPARSDDKPQKDYAQEVKYCGVPLSEIMPAQGGTTYVTFTAEEMRKPRKSLFLVDSSAKPSSSDEDAASDEDTAQSYYLNGHLAKSSQIQYFTYNDKLSHDDNSLQDYKLLRDILDDKELWEEEDSIRKVEPEALQRRNEVSFLSIIRKEYDELAYSNLLSYYFLKYKEAFAAFAKNVLGIDLDLNFTIARERYNIDLLIQDNNNVIIIENKIKSDINGLDPEEDKKKDKLSQLNKYYDKAKEIAEGRTVRCFIFAPDYHHLRLAQYADGEKYTIIRYSQILDFYRQRNDAKKDRHFEDFRLALEKHTHSTDERLSEEMLHRFFNAIEEIRKKP